MRFGAGLQAVLLYFVVAHALEHQQTLIEKTKKAQEFFNVAFDGRAEQLLDHFHVPGLSAAVVFGDQVYAKGYGYSHLETKIPASPDTQYYAGSTTKAFTAACLALLIDNQTAFPGLSWQTPLSSLIRSDFVLSDEWATNHITVEDALSHRSGLPGHNFVYGGTDKSVAHAIRSMRYLDFTEEPRTTYQYNNLMYTSVSHALSTITGQDFAAFLTERILHPLGMHDTYPSKATPGESEPPLARGYAWSDEDGAFRLIKEEAPLAQVDGAGVLVTTVMDYVKWLKVLIKSSPKRTSPSGPSEEPILLSKEQWKQLFTPRTLIPDDDPTFGPSEHFDGTRAYALGWHVSTYRGHPVLLHTGGLRGFGTLLVFLPEDDVGIVMMGNRQIAATYVGHVLTWDIVDKILGVPEAERYDFMDIIDSQIREGKEALRTAKDRLYPDIPDQGRGLPPQLPLSDYAGTYEHPAYGELNFTVSCSDESDSNHSSFVATLDENEWSKSRCTLDAVYDRDLISNTISLHHITGEYFLADTFDADSGNLSRRVRAKFNLGPNGKVTELCIELEDGLARQGKMIWFKRV